jgi:hypothetical protein
MASRRSKILTSVIAFANRRNQGFQFRNFKIYFK